MRVKDLMHRDVVTVKKDETCAVAAKLLREHQISSLIVSSPAGPTGTITQHDYVNMVADGQDPARVTVAERMTTNLITISPTADAAATAAVIVHAARARSVSISLPCE
jgi:CBS domain-containing protein